MRSALDVKESERHAAREELARSEARLKSEQDARAQLCELLEASEAKVVAAEGRAARLEGQRNEERLKHLKLTSRIETISSSQTHSEKRNKILFEKLGAQRLLEEAEKQCRDLTAQVIDMRAKQSNLEETCADAVKRAEEAEKRDAKLQVECGRLRREHDDADLERSKKAAELESEMKRTAYLQERVGELKESLEASERALNEEQTKREAVAHSVLEAQRREHQAQQRERECEEASQRLAEKIKSIALELDRAMGEIEAKEKERAAYKGKLDDAGAQIIALRQEIASLRHASDSLTKESSGSAGRIRMLEEKLKECQSKNEMLITEKLNSDARAEASEDRVEETLELYKEASAQLDDTLKRSAELEDRVNALVMGNAKRRASSLSPRRRKTAANARAVQEVKRLKEELAHLAHGKDVEIEELKLVHRNEQFALQEKLAKEQEFEDAKDLLQKMIEQYVELEKEKSLNMGTQNEALRRQLAEKDVTIDLITREMNTRERELHYAE